MKDHKHTYNDEDIGLLAARLSNLEAQYYQSKSHQDRRYQGEESRYIKADTKQSILAEVLKTVGLTVVGTMAIVSAHHGYRKRQQPNASLRDYWNGGRSLLSRIHQANNHAYSYLQHHSQQALQIWQQSYRGMSIDDDLLSSSSQSQASDKQCVQQIIDTTASHLEQTSLATVAWVSGVAATQEVSFDSGYAVVGISADKQVVWQTAMPERVHDIVVQPARPIQNEQKQLPVYQQLNQPDLARDVVVMGRRPSEKFWVLDAKSGTIIYTITAQPMRHFYGHACYSLDGNYLYVTENDVSNFAGKIGVYEVAKGYQKVQEYETCGIGPHELVMHPDGETLVIANGGIKTEKASREELNLESMQPSLVYIDRHDGALLEQIFPEHNQMSVRHLAMHDNGLVVIGIQFQGAKHLNIPLVVTHRRGESAFRTLSMPADMAKTSPATVSASQVLASWQSFHQYIASVAVDSKHNLVCATSPRGGCAAVFDLTTGQMIDMLSLADCAGVAIIKPDLTVFDDIQEDNVSGFLVSDGQGSLTSFYVDTTSNLGTNNLSDNISNNLINEQPSSTTQSANKPRSPQRQRFALAFDNHLQAL